MCDGDWTAHYINPYLPYHHPTAILDAIDVAPVDDRYAKALEVTDVARGERHGARVCVAPMSKSSRATGWRRASNRNLPASRAIAVSTGTSSTAPVPSSASSHALSLARFAGGHSAATREPASFEKVSGPIRSPERKR